MPLTPIQRMAVEVLRPFRKPHDYVAGGAALNQRWPRLSDDMDIFNDKRNQLPDNVDREIAALREAGFIIRQEVCTDVIVQIVARKGADETKIEWFYNDDHCMRFFEALRDDELGYRLHQADNAVNKVLCASSRYEAPRDAVDLVHIVRRYCPIGPLVWAATAKNADRTPLRMVGDIRHKALGYADEQIRAVRMEDGTSITRGELRETLDAALEAARTYCEQIGPTKYVDHLFVDESDTPVEATDKMIAAGAARAIPLRNFNPMPAVRD